MRLHKNPRAERCGNTAATKKELPFYQAVSTSTRGNNMTQLHLGWTLSVVLLFLALGVHPLPNIVIDTGRSITARDGVTTNLNGSDANWHNIPWDPWNRLTPQGRRISLYHYEDPELKLLHPTDQSLFWRSVTLDLQKQLIVSGGDINADYPKANYFFSSRYQPEKEWGSQIWAAFDLQPVDTQRIRFSDLFEVQNVANTWAEMFRRNDVVVPNAAIRVSARGAVIAEGYYELTDDPMAATTGRPPAGAGRNITTF